MLEKLTASLRNARRRYSVSRDGLLAVPIAGLQTFADLSPVLRVYGLQRLPSSFRAGAVGAEVATWGAIAPSLLPHKLTFTAANVAFLQGIGHAVATGVARAAAPGTKRRLPDPLPLPVRVGMTAVTTGAIGMAISRRARQEKLVEVEGTYSAWDTIGGLLLGTAGYGAILAVGEVVQTFIDALNALFGRRLPPVTSWPLAIVGGGAIIVLFADKVVVRRFFSRASRQALELDRAFMRGADRPLEPERSGSPASRVSWQSLGRQGRATVAGGPRAEHLRRVLGEDQVREPIRVVVGLHDTDPDSTPDFEAMAEEAVAEMHRTGAFARSHIAIMSGAGTGWINDFHTSGFEFVTRGDSAIVSMQYSFLPSAYSYVADHISPVRSTRILAKAVLRELEKLDPENRPKLYLGGESLGAYAVSDVFESVDEFLHGTSGGVFTGVPGFAHNHSELTRAREKGSPQRLPLVDGGRHTRFTAHPDHLHHDFKGDAYEHEWAEPRYVFAQHASDPVTWWQPSLLWRAPDWLREPGSRGVPAPEAQKLDVLHTLRWLPLVTFWQVGMDQLASQDVPSPHGHNYHDETVAYWNAVVHGVDGDRALSKGQLARASQWIHNDAVKLRKPADGFPSKYGY
ncbi:alpha/beta-hydrolase family protein [Corynebacterium riegelii]|uniref:alpha/beta-hydrolase family protein n=1 Tax=Corynebacterium riegelii TaxID=156976 RepID=UPI00191DFDFD|nr:alpha/beta-hydrolase family protein [Corynebacterium riegelii]QQU84422.1 alpha/beta-hydrolase family protein [Corynebacterium riegelii]